MDLTKDQENISEAIMNSRSLEDVLAALDKAGLSVRSIIARDQLDPSSTMAHSVDKATCPGFMYAIGAPLAILAGELAGTQQAACLSVLVLAAAEVAVSRRGALNESKA